ncbi:MAG: hypothetical protein ABL879_10965 [Devosia sp.]
MRALLAVALLIATPVFGADEVAEQGTPVGLVGQLIVDSADERTYEEAFAQTKSSFNVFGLDEGLLLSASGMRRFSQDMTGSAIRAGELSILMQFNTPGGKFEPTAETPAMIPFAFLKDGVCQAGYTAGFPTPTTTYVVDLADAPCSAYSVADLKAADYAAIEEARENEAHSLADGPLEQAVRAAYSAALKHAAAHDNYFAPNGDFDTLRAAIATALETDEFKAVVVTAMPSKDLAAASACLPVEGTELRIAVNAPGDGLTLAAVTDTRVFSYHYDPHEAADIKVAAAKACNKL